MDQINPDDLDDFLKTVAKVVRADGRVAEQESDFLESLRWLFTADNSVRLEMITSEFNAAMA